MLTETLAERGGRRIVLMDSISSAAPENAGDIVVSASHGGVSSGQFATRQVLGACFFNDAGVGKDRAGIQALAMLQELGVPGATLSHDSARIGDARDHWEHGVISHVNPAARSHGLREGQSVQDAVERLVEG
jgi:hypothetical protein